MAKIDFGGTVEEVITSEEFTLQKAREVLENETVAVLGYGVQGPGQALNMRDNGIAVIVGQRQGSASWDKAVADGFVPGETLLPIEEAAKKHHFDWRLIAAQIYQESHFNPRAKSHAGAYGLMQLTRSTARSLGVKDLRNSKQNIQAGVKHLSNLYRHFDQAQGSDRLFIALAAYNVGQGHIMDARNLARKKKLDPNKWGSLSKTLPLLSYRKYYKDAVYGYCRGREPLEYIKQIMIYYDILKHQDIEYRTEIPLVPNGLEPSSDKRIGALFPADGGLGTMSGKYGDIVPQGKQLVFDT